MLQLTLDGLSDPGWAATGIKCVVDSPPTLAGIHHLAPGTLASILTQRGLFGQAP